MIVSGEFLFFQCFFLLIFPYMHFVTLNTDAYTTLLISSIFLHLKLELPLSSSPGTFNMENAFAGWNALTEHGEVELGGGRGQTSGLVLEGCGK